MHEWLSGGVSPCQGEGRGFESRLVLLFFTGRNIRFCPFFKNNVLLESSERRISRWLFDIQQYIEKPAKMTHFEKIPRVHIINMEAYMVVTEYSLIGALLRFYPETIEDFREVGMNCVGCPSSAKETIGQACNVHSVDVNELIKRLDKRING